MSEQSSSREKRGNDPQLKQRPPSNLNLRHNDNAFHVLASLLVDFFQARLVIENGSDVRILNLSSDDKTALQRLLPKTAMWDFIDAVSYRLEMTPVVPTTPIHFLTVQCQELCLDKDETMENPILATYEISMADTVTINVLSIVLRNEMLAVTVPEDDSGSDDAVDYRGALRQFSDNSDDSDGFVHTNVDKTSSDVSSSDGSGIRVADSKDIADEMMQQERTINTGDHDLIPNDILSDNDSLPTEYDDDDFEEFLQNDKVDGKDVQLDQVVNQRCDDTEIGNDACDQTTDYKLLEDGANAISAPSVENLKIAKDENSDDAKEAFNFDVTGSCLEEEGEEIEVLPTMTGTFDDQTMFTFEETQGCINIDDDRVTPSVLCDFNPVVDPLVNELNDTDIGEEIVILPTETMDKTILSLHTVPGITSEVSQFDNEVIESNQDIEKENVVCESFQDNSQVQTGTIDVTPDDCTNENCKSKEALDIQDKVVSAKVKLSDKVNSSLTTGSLTTEGATVLDENPAHHIHDAAGAFFSELRHLIDEKIEAFEYAVVNAIVAKPLPRPNNDCYVVTSAHVGRESIKKVVDKSKLEDLVAETITKRNPSLLNTVESYNVSPHAEVANYVDEAIQSSSDNKDKSLLSTTLAKTYVDQIERDKIVSIQEKQQNENATKDDNRNFDTQVSPMSFSVQSGFSSLFAGLAANFAPKEKGGDSRSVQVKSIISTFPSDESHTDCSVVDFAVYESMQVTDAAAKQQLILELKEACTLMKQSITPETTRFWSDHIQCLKGRLNALETQQKEILVPPASQQDKVDSDPEAYYQQQATIVADASDIQSSAMMSEIRSTKGIPVVPALSQYSNDLNDQYDNECQAQSTLHTSTPNNGPQTPGDFDGFENKPQQYSHAEIELSESRGQFVPNPSDELYSHQHDSNTQQTIDNGEDGYYEYPLVDVVAPADLPGGYHFEAEIEGQRFLATVPAGGVQQGETFTCYMKELDSVAIDIPVGAWKDGLFHMCELGWCHPVLWNAIFCPLIALGQIQTRVHLDFLGRPKFGELPYTNRIMMLLVIASWMGMNTVLFAACNFKWSRGLELSVADGCAFVLVNVAMFGFIVFVTQSTRSSVREKFMIRERCCYDLEDVCCAALCLPCTVGQMQRHTANYDDYEAVCCSKTGLPNGVRVNQEAAKMKEPTSENEDGYMV